MSDYFGMKKVLHEMGTETFHTLQRANRVDCCEELRENHNQWRSNWIFWLYCDGRWDTDTPRRSTQPTRSKDLKKPSEKIPTWPRVTRSAGKIIMIIFWGLWRCSSRSIFYHMVLQSMVHITHHSFIGYVLLFRRNITEKLRRGVVLLHDNAPVHKSNITQTAIQYTGFTELNHPTYSPRSCIQRLSSVLKCEAFSSWQEFWERWWSDNDHESLFRVLIVIFFSRHRKLTWLMSWCNC